MLQLEQSVILQAIKQLDQQKEKIQPFHYIIIHFFATTEQEPTSQQLLALSKYVIYYQSLLQISKKDIEKEQHEIGQHIDFSPDNHFLHKQLIIAKEPHESTKYIMADFGKYKAKMKSWYQLFFEDQQYLEWMAKEAKNSPLKDLAWRTLCGLPIYNYRPVEFCRYQESPQEYACISRYDTYVLEAFHSTHHGEYDRENHRWHFSYATFKDIFQALLHVKDIKLVFDADFLEALLNYKLVIHNLGSEGTIEELRKTRYNTIFYDRFKYKGKDLEYLQSAGLVETKGDGFIHLYNKWSCQFPIGFLDDICRTLEKHSIPYAIQYLYALPAKQELQWYGATLRDYQIQAVIEAIQQERAFICLPTGTGKTYVGEAIIYMLGLPTLIIVHTKELLYQWKKRLEEVFHLKIGVIGDGEYTEEFITVSMVETASQQFPQHDYQLLIVDEGHHISADTYCDLAKEIKARYRIALSATPFREDGKDLKMFGQSGNLLFSISPDEAMEQGFLSEFKYIIRQGVKVYYEAQWQERLKNICLHDYRNSLIINDCIKEFNRGHRIYVDVRRVDQGKKLQELLKQKDIPAIWLYGKDKTPRRKEVLERFESEHFILISTLIKEGVDLPAMTMVYLASPFRSGIMLIQTLGRALRPKSNEEPALLYMIDDPDQLFSKWFNDIIIRLQKYYGRLKELDLYSIKTNYMIQQEEKKKVNKNVRN